ncbi:MAG TPA: dolichyl-phosphate beta-glucosyltransferase [Dongiaceae bacterium]|nr:dolichyl-phosphate beta-glucosyltransferase [Dongiaceae bacterium]
MAFTLSIVIPAHNEEKRLPRTLDHILSWMKGKEFSVEIIVVNDGSTDETAMVVREYAAQHPCIVFIDHLVNAGKGSGIRDGMLRAKGDIILFTDADDSTPIEDADRLIAEIRKGADIVIGSRWVDRNLQTQPQPWYRRLNGRIYNLLLRNILGLDLTDTQNGFKAFTQEAGKACFAVQRIPGWGFDAESLFFAYKLGYKVVEVPVEYTYYPEGSKIRPYRDGARMLLELLLVRWYYVTGAYAEVSAQAKAQHVSFGAQSLGETQVSE